MELNIIKQTGTWGEASNSINENFAKIDVSLEAVKESTIRNKGYFPDVNSLRLAYPTASLGSKAYVGTKSPYSIYLWDGDGWYDSGEKSEEGSSGELYEQVNNNTQKITELEERVEAIEEGGVAPEVAYYDVVGDGGTSLQKKTVAVIEANTTKRLVLKAITDIVFTGTSNGTFVDLHSFDAGTSDNEGFVWENRADPGATYAAGTVIKKLDYTFVNDTDLLVRGRFTGTVRLYISDVAEGEFDAEGKYNELSIKVGNVESKVETLEDRIDNIEGSSGEIPPTVIAGTATGTKEYSSTQKWKIGTIPAGETSIIILKAVTDLTYASTSGDGNTFVDIFKWDAGTTNNGSGIFYNTGNAGDYISAGTIIYEGEYTFDNESDVYIRGRFIGTAELTITYGGKAAFNAEESYNALKDVTDNHETRIKTLESGNQNDIIFQYKHQIGKALQLGYVESRSTSLWPILPLVFMHISDTHKATNNTRAFEVLNYLGANGHVQFLMHTGDILEDPKSASQSRWSSIVAPAQYPVMLTAGNHDVGNWATASGQYTTTAQFHNTFITPILNSWGLKADGLGTPYTSGKNYYFKDFTDQKIRFVVVDEFELPDQYASDGTTLLAGRGARWISQGQADWFVYTLRTTPNGYGVIVAKHAPDGRRGEDKNPFNSPYLKGKDHQQSYQYYNGSAYTTFFADIVQAFIDKTTLSKTIQQSAGAITGSVTISADFTATTNCEFICYVTGHTHADGINFLKDYPYQLDLNINCNNTHYQHYSNLQLIAGSPYEDAINVYSVDRNNGLIHVVRIGGEYSADGDRRDMLTINYRNPNAVTGDFDAEGAIENLSTKVSTNTTNIASLTTRMSNAEKDIANHEERILDIEEGGYGGGTTPEPTPEPTIITATATGIGNYSSTERWRIAMGLQANLAVHIKITASTTVSYSSRDNAEHTFVDLVYYPAGTTTPTNVIWENRGNVGDSYAAGTVIKELDYTIPVNADIWLRGRFVGDVIVEISYYE